MGDRKVSDEIDGDWKMNSFKTCFKAMTFPGGVISIGGRVRSADDSRILLDITARSQTGEVRIAGTAELTR